VAAALPKGVSLAALDARADGSEPVDLRAAALRSSALYSLLLWHHWHSQMHRPWPWRHPAQAPVEHVLNTDKSRATSLFYFSTCGWMMWNWLVSGLAAGATLLLYDGSPFHPTERVLFDFADEGGHDHLRHLGQIYRRGEEVRLPSQGRHMKLEKLRAMFCQRARRSADEASTSSMTASRSDMQLASISGRHRHLRLLRRRQSDVASLAAVRSRGRCSAWPSMSLMRGKARARREGRTGLHPAFPVHAGDVLE
jgi:hypothetical protein